MPNPKKVHSIKFSSVGPRGLLDFYRKEPQTVIRNVRKLWHFYLKNIVPNRATNGHSDYVRFIIVGRTRTGSNLLRGSLMSHDHIVVFGDLFRGYNRKRQADIKWGLPYYPQSRSILSLAQDDPIRFLETEVFGKFPKRVSAVGFKALYPHANKESWSPILTYLGNQRAFKIIHIKRKNILKTHLSLRKIGRRKDKWANISGPEEENSSIFLDYEDCLRAFTDTKKWEKEHDIFFENHDKIEVLYENLSSDYENEMRRIQEFLGVDYQVLKPLTYKQSRQPLSRAISNYFELKEGFQDTPWEEFFED
jgi:LPS sulfotransferase NodH